MGAPFTLSIATFRLYCDIDVKQLVRILTFFLQSVFCICILCFVFVFLSFFHFDFWCFAADPLEAGSG